MNDVYFICHDCKVVVNAGYRWAFELDIKLGNTVDPIAVLTDNKYWSPPRDKNSSWLYDEVFPTVRDFFRIHHSHRLEFNETHHLYFQSEFAYLKWIELGFIADPMPRYWAEVMGFTDWSQVVASVADMSMEPWWWDSDEDRDQAKKIFLECVQGLSQRRKAINT